MVFIAAASGLQRKLKEEVFAILPSIHAKEVGLGRMTCMAMSGSVWILGRLGPTCPEKPQEPYPDRM